MKIEKKAVEECGFTLTKHETLHLSQWMQKHLEQHQGMRSFPHHGHNRGGESPWGLMIDQKCNVLDRKPEDGEA